MRANMRQKPQLCWAVSGCKEVLLHPRDARQIRQRYDGDDDDDAALCRPGNGGLLSRAARARVSMCLGHAYGERTCHTWKIVT